MPTSATLPQSQSRTVSLSRLPAPRTPHMRLLLSVSSAHCDCPSLTPHPRASQLMNNASFCVGVEKQDHDFKQSPFRQCVVSVGGPEHRVPAATKARQSADRSSVIWQHQTTAPH